MKKSALLLALGLLVNSQGLLLAVEKPMENFMKNSMKDVMLDDLMTPDEIAAEMVSEGVFADSSSSGQTLTIKPGDTMLSEFVVIVNKAAKGTTAQTLRAYHLGNLKHEWKISTGREKFETAVSGRQYVTTTPVGYFRPTSTARVHHSNTWNADMEFTVFFIGGIALHSTTPSHYAELGTRASGGCVRQRRENAETIYNFILSIPKKEIPVFDRKGNPVLDGKGIQKTTLGRDVMIIVQSVQD